MSRGKSSPAQITSAALRLFGEHGVHGTSLQMIADELGVSKAAVYYHFRSKHDIVVAVLKPAMDGLANLVAAARECADQQCRVETVVEGLADGAIAHREVYSVVLRDVAALSVVSAEGDLLGELHSHLLGDSEDPVRQMKVAMFLSGLVAPAVDQNVSRMADEEMRDAIVAVGMELAR